MPTTEELNKARELAVANGGDPYAGNLKNAGTFGVDKTVGDIYKPYAAPAPVKPVRTYVGADGNTYNNDNGELVAPGDIRPVDENAVRSSTIARFQQEIDAVNSVYGEKLREAKTQGLSRLGSTTAADARAGVLGSDFGQAHNEKVVEGNTAIEDSVRAEQMAKIAAIMGNADTVATQEIAAKKKAQTEGLDSYIKYLGGRTERKLTNLKTVAASIINQKLDPSQIKPEELQKLADSYGVTVDEIKNQFTADKKVADQAAADKALANAKDSRVTVPEGNSIYELQKDGSYKLIAKNPKTLSPGSGSKNKLTAAEAIKHGLPSSLVGSTEDQILVSLDSQDIPRWFADKANAEANQSLTPAALAPLWEAYRGKIKTSYQNQNDGVDINALVEALSN